MGRGAGAASAQKAVARPGSRRRGLGAPAPQRAAVDRSRLNDDRWWPGPDGDIDAMLAAQGARWAGMLADATVRVRVPRAALEQILADGRVKSQWETGTSRAHLSLQARADAEQALLGLDPGTPAQRRPVYGYLAGSCRRGEQAVSGYGDVILELRPGARSRSR